MPRGMMDEFVVSKKEGSIAEVADVMVVEKFGKRSLAWLAENVSIVLGRFDKSTSMRKPASFEELDEPPVTTKDDI